MDVSVSHLNNRLALQLPRELPLGLVFVTGTVSFSGTAVSTEIVAHGRYQHLHFDLIDDRHRIRCVLVVRVGLEHRLELGSRVRVGGHLRFDPQRADYYLLARDLEPLDEDVFGDVEEVEADQEEVAALLADIRKRTTQQKLRTDLPEWIQALAPEPFQSTKKDEGQVDTSTSSHSGKVPEEAASDVDTGVRSSISALLDQPGDVELTPDLISTLEEKAPILDEDLQPQKRQVAARARASRPDISRATDQEHLPWLLLLIFILIIIIVVLLAML